MKRSNLLLMASFASAVIFLAQPASAQQGLMNCPMCGSMGWGSMVLSALLIISLIAVFVALTIFLIRKSRVS